MAPRARTTDGRAASLKAQQADQAKTDEAALQEFKTAFGRAESHHAKMTPKWRERHKAYLGILDQAADQSASKELAPKYAFQCIETLVANLVDEQTAGRVLPCGPDSVLSAKGIEHVMASYRKQDEEDAKRPPFVRQAVIMGRSPAKVFWTHDRTPRSFRRFHEQADGPPIDSRVPGFRVVDRTSFEPLDVNDFLPDPHASRTDQMGFACSRYWVTMETLKAREKRTVDGEEVGAYYNLDKVADTRSDTGSDTKQTGRDNRGRIEVIEYWTRNKLITVANRMVVIQNDEMPYDHGQLPFIVAATTPDLYSLDGISVADIVAPLQGAAWEVLNGLVEAVRIANLLLIKADVSQIVDLESLAELQSGTVLKHNGNPDALEFWNAGGSILQPGMDFLSLLKTTMQEVSGANVYLAGGASETIDQKTATGISIVQSMAQKLILAMRGVIWQEYRRKGLQEIALIQQFMVKGLTYREKQGDGYDFPTVWPWDIQGECDYDTEDADKNLNQQQARAEQLEMFNTLATQVPNLMQTDAEVHFVPLIAAMLESFGKFDTATYVTQRAPAMPALAPVPGPGQMPPFASLLPGANNGSALAGSAA